MLPIQMSKSPEHDLSSPAKAGDPVRRGFSIQSLLPLQYWIARSRLRRGFAGPRAHSAALALAKAASRATTIVVWRETQVLDLATGFRPSFANSLSLSVRKGRRESRALTAPAAPCAMRNENAHGLDRYSRDIPAFPAQGKIKSCMKFCRAACSPHPIDHPNNIPITCHMPS